MVYILVLIAVALLAALVITRLGQRKETPAADEKIDDNRPSDCCGAHEVCESDSLLNSSDSVEYYNDEELDAYKGLNPTRYSDNEIEEFREVLLTLMPREVAGWLKSLQLRGIDPPIIIRDEALMIVAERRFESK
jgi:hypothetical protein